MCGKYRLTSTTQALQQLFGITADFTVMTAEKMTPGMTLPVFHDDAFHVMTWGLIPAWSADKKLIVNARGETLGEKPTFKNTRRCLVPVNGYFERDEGGTLFDIHRDGNAPFAFGAVYEGERFSLVTQNANDDIRAIHDRMPVILHDRASCLNWLGGCRADQTRPPRLVARVIEEKALKLQADTRQGALF